ncbi:AMP-dependent synthetase and ligase [Burkholderia sp. H160]|nr:AMP-dependent synthetase and ligase [Burkholderia sp. H160]
MLNNRITEFTAEGLVWTDASLWQQFNALHEADAQALAVVDGTGREWSRSELYGLATLIAKELGASGVGAHDRVMVEGRKTANTLAAALAISSVGAVTCPYTPDLGKSERSVIEQRLGHVALIGSSEVNAKAIPGVEGLYLTLCERQDRTWDETDKKAALIAFTSGTTGIPKGVMHSVDGMNYATRACARVAGLERADAIVGVVPLGSAPGFTFTLHFSLSLGHPLIIVDPWDPRRALELMDAHNCRWGMCVPTHLHTMVECARSGQWSKRSPLKALAVGGSAMTTQLIADADELLGIPVLRMYGMSECMGHCSALPTDSLEVRQNSDGKPFPGTQDQALDAQYNPLPAGERGQAGVKGPSLFLKYAEGLGSQEYRLTENGYFLTGDEIVVGHDGYIKVVGRLKDQIIRGGYNVDPAEVEAAVLKHPAIENAIVVGVPHPKLGEQACAICVIRPGFPTLQLSDLAAHLETIGLTKKKWPEHLVIVDKMLVTTTGKVDKKILQKNAIVQLNLG